MDETTILILLLTILVIIVYSFYFINIKKCKKKTKEKFTDTDTCDRGNGWQNGGTDFCGDDNAFVCFIRRLVCYIKDLTTKKANVNNCMTDANVNCRQKIAENNPNKYCYAQPGKKCTNSQNNGAGSCDDCNTNCPAGEYADKIRYGVAAKSCTACPAGQTSSVGSTAFSDCTVSGGSSGTTVSDCPPGKTGNSESCTDCPAGTYKETTGSLGCTSCADGTYSTTVGATVASTCTSYTTCSNQNREETTGGTTIAQPVCGECLEGYTQDSSSDDCVQCGAGTYKSSIGDGSCTLCPANTYSTTVGATLVSTCMDCPSGQTSPQGSADVTACSGSSGSSGASVSDCPPGKTGNSGSCTNCPAGTYKDTTGSLACTSCADGTYSTTVGATVASTCTSYTTCSNQNREETTGGTTITQPVCGECLEGYTQDSSSDDCVQCAAGTYKSSIGDGSCTLCDANTYSTTVGATLVSTCMDCPSGQTSPQGSADVTACSGSSGSASGTDQLLTSDTPGAITNSNGNEFICKPGFYQKYNAAGYSLDECDYCPPNYYCPGEEVGEANIVNDDDGISRGAGLKVCPMRANTDEATALGETWTYSQYQTFTCGSDFNRTIDFWSDDYDTRQGTSLKKYCSYDLLNGNSEFEYVRGGGAPAGKMNCANQYLNNGDDNYQCNLQVSEDDCLKLYNVPSEQTQSKNNLMTNKCSTTEPVLPDASNIERERYCCPNSRTPGDDKTGTYAGSLLGGSC